MNLSKIFAIIFVIISLLSIQSKADSIIRNREFDSINALLYKSLKRGDKAEAMKIMLDKGKMLYHKGLYSSAIMSLDSAIKLSNDGKDTLQYPAMKELYMECLNIKSVTLSYLSRYEEAINCCIQIDKYNVRRDWLYKTKFFNSMGVIFGMSGKLDQAIEYYRQAFVISKKLENKADLNSQLFSIQSNLGGVFVQKHEFDSAQLYLMEAQKLAILMKDKKKEVTCLHILGLMNKNMGKYEFAINYYDEAYQLALDCGDHYMLPFLKRNISNCYISMKNYDLALKTAFEALDMARRNNSKLVEILSLINISQMYKQMGDASKALDYLERSNKIKDSLFSHSNEEKFVRQKTDFDMYRVSMEKEVLEKGLELENSQRMFNNLIIFILTLALAVLSCYLTYRLIKQRRLNRELKQQRDIDITTLTDERKHLECEIERKNREMSLSELSLVKKAEQGALAMAKLKALKTNFPLKGKGLEIVNELEDLVIQMSSGNQSDSINYYLDQVALDFYDKLDVLYPELTPSDRKICALISLGLTSKDISTITGKTHGAINNVKSRIRKKINVEQESDLTEFFFRLRV